MVVVRLTDRSDGKMLGSDYEELKLKKWHEGVLYIIPIKQYYEKIMSLIIYVFG